MVKRITRRRRRFPTSPRHHEKTIPERLTSFSGLFDDREVYGEVLGLRAVGRSGLTFRVGDGLLLLFDAGLSSAQSRPPPHGAQGPIHTCFVAAADDYEAWKQRVSDEASLILQEIDWDNGVRSFYFHDPAGNLLEIADGDLWPES